VPKNDPKPPEGGAPPPPPDDKGKKDAEKKKDDRLGVQLQGMLQESAAKFIKQNIDDAGVLGEDLVRAIFAQQFIATMPALMQIPEGASIELRLAAEEIMTQRSEVAQLIAKAERENSARIARVRGNASTFVGNLAKSVFTIVGGFAAKALLGA